MAQKWYGLIYLLGGEIIKLMPTSIKLNAGNQKGFTIPILVLGIALVLIVSAGGYFFYNFYKTKENVEIGEPDGINVTYDKAGSEITLISPASIQGDAGIPVKAHTVSFTKVGEKIYLRYKGKVYDGTEQYKLEPVNLVNADNLKWYGLVDSPFTNPKDIFASDELFGFKIFPKGEKFIFVMRWDDQPVGDTTGFGQVFKVFYFDPSGTNKVTNILSTSTGSNEEYSVIKIDEVSPDEKYISFDMYGCWNCGGHAPEKLLLKIETKETKRVGKIIEFEWEGNGKYSYKDYMVKPCETLGPGECFEDAKNLPLKKGQF